MCFVEPSLPLGQVTGNSHEVSVPCFLCPSTNVRSPSSPTPSICFLNKNANELGALYALRRAKRHLTSNTSNVAAAVTGRNKIQLKPALTLSPPTPSSSGQMLYLALGPLPFLPALPASHSSTLYSNLISRNQSDNKVDW